MNRWRASSYLLPLEGKIEIGAIRAALLGVAAALAVLACSPSAGGEPQSADASDAELVARGRGIYDQQCASCHGVNLEGQPNWRLRNDDGTLPAPPHDESGHTWHHPDDVLFQLTKQGTAAFLADGYKSNMPAYADILTDAEIWAVLAYVKSRWPPEIQAAQASR